MRSPCAYGNVHRKHCAPPDGQGPSRVEDNKIFPPRRGDMKRSMEALIHHFKLSTPEGFHVPAGEVYAAVEAPKGRVRQSTLSPTGKQQAYKCKISAAPGFCASAGDGFHLQGPSAGRRLGHPGFARHRVSEKSIDDGDKCDGAGPWGPMTTMAITDDRPATRGVQDLLDHGFEVVAKGELLDMVECERFTLRVLPAQPADSCQPKLWIVQAFER